MKNITLTAKKKVPLAATAVQEALPFIEKYFKRFGYMPTAREVALGCGRGTAQWGRLALAVLVKLKHIKIAKGKFRAITLLNNNK